MEHPEAGVDLHPDADIPGEPSEFRSGTSLRLALPGQFADYNLIPYSSHLKSLFNQKTFLKIHRDWKEKVFDWL